MMSGAAPIEQLDLVVYEPAVVRWWAHPFILVAIVCLAVACVMLIWLIVSRVRARRHVPITADTYRQLVESVSAQVHSGLLEPALAMVTIMGILKAYLGWYYQDPSITALSDVELAETIKKIEKLVDLAPMVDRLIMQAEGIKFNREPVTIAIVEEYVSFARNVLNRLS